MCHLSGDCPGVLRWVEHQYLRIYACREQSQDQSVYTIITQILTEKVDHVVHIGGSQTIPRLGQGCNLRPSSAREDLSGLGGLKPRKASRH